MSLVLTLQKKLEERSESHRKRFFLSIPIYAHFPYLCTVYAVHVHTMIFSLSFTILLLHPLTGGKHQTGRILRSTLTNNPMTCRFIYFYIDTHTASSLTGTYRCGLISWLQLNYHNSFICTICLWV